jgi:hypothetical protein
MGFQKPMYIVKTSVTPPQYLDRWKVECARAAHARAEMLQVVGNNIYKYNIILFYRYPSRVRVQDQAFFFARVYNVRRARASGRDPRPPR